GLEGWVKACHAIAAIAWMAGLLYLPRLMVYHWAAPPGSPQSETFKIMERRLLRGIMTPAMILTWGLGLWLAWWGGWFTSGWLMGKLLGVGALSAVHRCAARWVKHFASHQNRRTQRISTFCN